MMVNRYNKIRTSLLLKLISFKTKRLLNKHRRLRVKKFDTCLKGFDIGTDRPEFLKRCLSEYDKLISDMNVYTASIRAMLKIQSYMMMEAENTDIELEGSEDGH